MKQEKVGLTTMNWILSIGGIILLSLFIILPPVFRVVFKEAEKPQEEIKEYPMITTTCYKENIQTDTTTDVVTYIFQHKNNELKSYTKTTKKSYLDPNIYDTDKQSFGRLVTAFSVLSGYNYTVTPSEEEDYLLVQENYDLAVFKSTMIVIPGNTEPTSVSSEYLFNQSINEMENELTVDGYFCSQND